VRDGPAYNMQPAKDMRPATMGDIGLRERRFEQTTTEGGSIWVGSGACLSANFESLVLGNPISSILRSI